MVTGCGPSSNVRATLREPALPWERASPYIPHCGQSTPSVAYKNKPLKAMLSWNGLGNGRCQDSAHQTSALRLSNHNSTRAIGTLALPKLTLGIVFRVVELEERAKSKRRH